MTTPELEQLFKALANRKRIEIMRLIDKREYSMSDVADNIKLSIKSTNKHLQLLYQAGLVNKSRRANLVFYTVVSNATPPLSQLLRLIRR